MLLFEVSAYLWFLFLPQLFSSHPCAEALGRQLDAWHVTDEVVRAPGGPLGGAVYRVATDELGEWVTVHQPRGLATVSLFFTDAEGTRQLEFGQTCEPEAAPTLPAPSPPPGAFTDEDLKRLLAEDERLVVYLWSPHLPLSVEAYHEIADAAASLGIPFVAVADATADRGFVERVGDSDGIPVDARRPMSSVELLFRDLAVHTPSMIAFAGGQVSAPLPGYRNRAAYRVYLETIFDKSGFP